MEKKFTKIKLKEAIAQLKNDLITTSDIGLEEFDKKTALHILQEELEELED